MKKFDFAKIDVAFLNDLKIVTAKDQISRDLDGEAAILNMKTGVYYGLNETGARIWQLVQVPIRIKKVLDVLITEYDVEYEQCEEELLSILNEMVNCELIMVVDEKNKEISSAYV
jgi:hypothetical protein